MTETLTATAVARLARVERPLVSMWRKRYAHDADPFPQPVTATDGRELFDAEAVGLWLQRTGLGKNPEALSEISVHSSLGDTARERLRDSATLMLIQSVLGGLLSDIDPTDASRSLIGTPAEAVLEDLDEAADLLEDTGLTADVDRMIEAAFTGRAVLDSLVTGLLTTGGGWAHEALTAQGKRLFGAVCSELSDLTERTIVPVRPGGHVLVHALLQAAGPDARLRFGLVEGQADSDSEHAAWCWIAAAGHDIERFSSISGASPALVLTQQQSISDPAGFFLDLDNMTIELGADDIALVVGSSNVLIDNLEDVESSRARRDYLSPVGVPAPVRAVMRLPRRLSRFGGQRRLGLWLLARASASAEDSFRLLYGEHAQSSLSAAEVSSIAADAAVAAVGGGQMSQHQFLRGLLPTTKEFLTRDSLVVTASARADSDEGEALTTVQLLRDGVLPDDLRLSRGDPMLDTTVSWSMAMARFARDLPGSQLRVSGRGHREESFSVEILGPDEIRNPSTVGRRVLDFLQITEDMPRARRTEPGDVVYVATGTPAAWVDPDGGRLVEAPARILRLRPDLELPRVLDVRLVAHDISRQESRDRRTWTLRTIPRSATLIMTRATSALRHRRAEALDALRKLDELEEALLHGLSSGLIRPGPTIVP